MGRSVDVLQVAIAIGSAVAIGGGFWSGVEVMRAISFMLTTAQVLAETKDVTRRNGWETLKPGDRLRGVRKAMGLKKGERHEVLKIIEVVSVRRERLDAIDQADVVREGFPEMTPAEFVAMFCKSHTGVKPDSIITRIEFKYVKGTH